MKIIHSLLSYNEALVVAKILKLYLRYEQFCQSFFNKKVVQESSRFSGLVERAADPSCDLRALNSTLNNSCDNRVKPS